MGSLPRPTFKTNVGFEVQIRIAVLIKSGNAQLQRARGSRGHIAVGSSETLCNERERANG